MAYDPTRPLMDQAISMAWNNTYEETTVLPTEADAEVHARMHKLMETNPGVFKALCTTAGIDTDRYTDDLRTVESMSQKPGLEQ